MRRPNPIVWLVVTIAVTIAIVAPNEPYALPIAAAAAGFVWGSLVQELRRP